MNRKMTSEHSSRARGKLKIGDDWVSTTKGPSTPKAPDALAQGNALGPALALAFSPEGA